MPFVLVITGLLMIVTGARNTYAQFGSQLAADFTGDHNFTYWLAAIGSVGAIGYIDALRTISRMFLALILIAMVLANKGFFNQLTAALKAGPTAPAASAGASGGSSGTPVKGSTTGLFGDPATSTGQSKFNGWMNYFFGTGG